MGATASGSPVSNSKGTLSLIRVRATGAMQLALMAGPPRSRIEAAVMAAERVRLTMPPLAAE